MIPFKLSQILFWLMKCYRCIGMASGSQSVVQVSVQTIALLMSNVLLLSLHVLARDHLSSE